MARAQHPDFRALEQDLQFLVLLDRRADAQLRDAHQLLGHALLATRSVLKGAFDLLSGFAEGFLMLQDGDDVADNFVVLAGVEHLEGLQVLVETSVQHQLRFAQDYAYFQRSQQYSH